jgi:hypothetical protein
MFATSVGSVFVLFVFFTAAPLLPADHRRLMSDVSARTTKPLGDAKEPGSKVEMLRRVTAPRM